MPRRFPNRTNYNLNVLLRAWVGGLDKKMHREELFIRINEFINRAFDLPSGTNSITKLDVPLADENDKDFEIGHENQGHCTVFFTHKKYADFFKSLGQVEFHPTEYYDREKRKTMQSKAISTWVDIKEPDLEKIKKSKPFNNIHLSQLHEHSTPRTPSNARTEIRTYLAIALAQRSVKSNKKSGLTSSTSKTKSQPDPSPTVSVPVTQPPDMVSYDFSSDSDEESIVVGGAVDFYDDVSSDWESRDDVSCDSDEESIVADAGADDTGEVVVGAVGADGVGADDADLTIPVQPTAGYDDASSDSDEQSKDDSTSQPGESSEETPNDAAPCLTRDAQLSPENAADLGPTLSQMQKDLFKHD